MERNNIVTKQQTKKELTPLIQLVCKRTELMRLYYLGSSWDTNTKITKNTNISVCKNKTKKLKFQPDDKLKENVCNDLFSIEKVCNTRRTYIFECTIFILID